MFLKNIQSSIAYALLVVALCCTTAVKAQLIAFPGAEGAGKYTTGGRGTATTPTTVFEVTNLSDDGQPGSLRYALTAPATYRTVVFRVSGTIHLTSRLNIRANTTIAGQSAPGDGICVADHPVVINGDNIIVRFMRFRMGDKNQNKGMVDGSGGDDTFGGEGHKNIIIDHCSVSWSSDEALTVYGGDSTTLQWNIISEPLNYSYHYESPGTDYQEHGYGGIWGGRKATFHHNLIAHAKGRMPRFSGVSQFGNVVGAENGDFRNNVIYNWGDYSTNGGEGGNYNVVNNYYKYGPSTSAGTTSGVAKRNMIMNPSKATSLPYPKIYASGNYVDGSTTVTENNWKGIAMAGGSLADTALSKVDQPFDLPAIPTQSAQEAYESVLQGAGCSLPFRDTLDQRIVSDVRNRTGRIIDVQGGYPHGTAYDQTVNAWPALRSTAAPVDTDRDGMPDTWESANGLDPNNAADRAGLASNGYTHLENYLNSLAVQVVNTDPVIYAAASFTAFAQTLGTPSAAQTFPVSGNNLAGDITVTAPAPYELSLNGSTWSSTVTLTPSTGSVASTSVSVRLNAAVAGTYNGVITHTSSGAPGVNLSVSGTATTPAASSSAVLQHWPLTTNAQDSAAGRAAGVKATTPVFNNLYISNNTTLLNTGTPMPPYSGHFGQAFGASAAGDGYWSTGQGGPGSTLKRIFYEQFTLKPSSGFSVKVDSIRFNAAFYNTANGKFAIAYSKSGFTADSVEVAGASFATPVATPDQKTGLTAEWVYALSGTDGVTLAAGDSLTVRLYFAAGTSSNGRYALLRDVKFIGSASGSVAPAASAITTTGTLNPFTQTVGAASATQTYTVSGTDLAGDLTVTPPPSFEVSANGTTWHTATAPLVLNPTAGAVSNTTISVRLNAAASGSYSGDITHASAGAAAQTVAVSGTASAPVVVTPPPAGTNVVVAKDGSGNFTTVQAAIDAAPTGRTTPYVIYIRNGQYKEKITIPSNKPYIHLIGESAAGTILTWDDYSGKPMPGGGTYGTANSASLTVNATDCLLANLTVENTTGDSPQALAISVSADRVVLVNCRFLGGQDTVLAYNSGRSYFKNCYIDGTVDFIFGNGKAVFDSTVIYPKTRQDGLTGSYITAANTPQGQAYGFVFRDCVIPSNFGTTSYVLGRPWQNDGSTATPAHNKTVFLNTTMGQNVIKPEGWSTWTSATNTSVIYYGEYRSRQFDSSLVDVSRRVPWSYQLTAAEAASYTFANIFGTWDPCAVSPLVCNSPARELAVSNFKAKKGTASTPSLMRWNISWPMAGITYELFRSTDKVTFSKINEQVAVNDTVVNFSYSEAIPPPGETYYYYVRASKSGLAPHLTDTVQVSSTPTITVSGTLGSFNQGVGKPSAVQVYTVSGVNLTTGVTITPPAGYEVSANNGTDWFGSTTPLVLAQNSGALAATTISVRLNAATAGSYTGTIVHTSTGATAVDQPVNGTVQSGPLPPPAAVLQHWPMSFNNEDSAAVRSTGVGATTPVFNKLYLSNGTTVAAIPAYSPQFGQAFGASANGDGSWGTGVGGPGGNLNRTIYNQFTITAASRYTVRIDSLALTMAFYNSSSNTRLAVVYSKSGFATDSADVTGGTGPGGALLSTANGGFSTPVLLANQTNGPTNTYAFALADANGITLAPGETLTIRLYNSCGSTSTGRYAMLKDVKAKGLVIIPTELTTTGTLSAFRQVVGSPSAVQTYTVSGTDLTGPVTITPPANYQVSADGGTTWFNNTTPLVLNHTGGALAATTISVRLNAGAVGTYSGNINISTPGATARTVAVTGTTAATTVTVSSTLSAFQQVNATPSAVQTYTVSATSLATDLTITPPAGYEVSADGGTAWFNSASPLVLAHSNGTLAATTISVRLKATTRGEFNGTITHTAGSESKASVAVSGRALLPAVTVAANLQAFTQTAGAPSAVQTFTISGVDLLDNLAITAPEHYQVSTDGVRWFSGSTQLVLQPVNRSVAAVTIQVRQNAPAAGTYSGALTMTSEQSGAVSVEVTGVAHPMFSISPNPVNNTLTIYHPRLANALQLTIWTASGAKVATYRSVVGSNTTTLNVSALPAGVYYLEYVGWSVRSQLPFVKQ